MISRFFLLLTFLLFVLSFQTSASPLPVHETKGAIGELVHPRHLGQFELLPLLLSEKPKQSKTSTSQPPSSNNCNYISKSMSRSYLAATLSPCTITTRPKSLLKVNAKFTYFTFDKNTQLPIYALGSSQQIQKLEGDAPMFTVAADNIIYREDTDAIAFIRRAHHNKDGAPLPYGGRLAYPAGFFDFTDGANSEPNTKHQGTDFISNQALVSKMQQGALRELKEEAPELLKLVLDAHTQTLFQGFASTPDRDIRYQLMRDYLPTTSAVFFTTLKKGPNFVISGADDAAGHRLVWVQRKTLLSLAKHYSPEVHKVTYEAIDKQYNENMEFTVQDFAFDHLKLAEAVFSP